MRNRIALLLCLIFACVSLAGCASSASGDKKVKRPVDYAESKWTCDVADITFSVSKDCEVTDATLVNKNGETVEISIVFTEVSEGKIWIKSADGSEPYLCGSCSYSANEFYVTVTDVYNYDFDTPPYLVFERLK